MKFANVVNQTVMIYLNKYLFLLNLDLYLLYEITGIYQKI